MLEAPTFAPDGDDSVSTPVLTPSQDSRLPFARTGTGTVRAVV